MSFSDKDLKQLKEIQDEANYRYQIDKGDGSPGSDRWVTLAALLARLEAAEAYLHKVFLHSSVGWEEYQNWKKTAGKDKS